MTERKIKISAVSYLNTKPFLHGIESSGILGDCELMLDIPSVCADKVVTGQADIGLVPVAAIPALDHHRIITDYCIGCRGAVGSVKLFSQVPLSQVAGIYLDYQSRTSALLARLLADKYWNISPAWLEAFPGFENKITGVHAGLVIGDRTFDLNGKFSYDYDLGQEWHDHTGLPFVFACWVASTDVPDGFLKKFNAAVRKGVEEREAVIGRLNGHLPEIETYLNHSISYEFDSEKKKALAFFLKAVGMVSNVSP